MMLMTTILKVSAIDRDARFCVGAEDNYRLRSGYGLFQRIGNGRFPIDLKWAGSLAPMKRLRSRVGIVFNSEVDVWLDLSGFGFGDFWGAEKIKSRIYPMLREKKQRGTPVILLPQALGPFKSESVRRAFQPVVEGADLIFIRDSASEKYIAEAYGSKSTFFRCPDFTIDLPSYKDSQYSKLSGRPAIVPNSIVFKTGNALSNEIYVDILRSAAKTFYDRGEEPFLLLHDEVQDREIADILQTTCKYLDAISEPRPAVMKDIVGSCSRIVASRFHALVSSLSQGVPSIGIGWAHKYAELFKDYGASKWLLPVEEASFQSLSKLLGEDLKPSNRQVQSATLLGHASAQRILVADMWEKISDIIVAGA